MKTNAESRSESPVGSVVPRSPASAARRLTITYALAATGWLLVFDFLLDEFVKDDFWNRVLSAVLAMIFVAFTSVVLYVSWRRELEHLDHTRQALAATNAQLADRETRLNHLFEHAPLGIAVVRSGQLEFVNPTLARMFGFTDMPAMLAVPLSSLLAANSRAALAEFQSIGRAQAYRHELTAVRQDGSEFEVELNAKAIGQADGQAVLAFVTDITNRKLAEATLRVSEERLKSTMDSMLEGGQIIGFDWRYIYVNDALEVQGRQPREDLLGHTMMEAYPGIENTGLFAVLRRCMDGRQPERMETEFIFQDGSRGWFDLSIQPVSEGIFILSHDITARKRAEENIQRQLDRLAALRAIDLAITGSLDLRIALDVVVRQAVEQLSVDAAAVLLLDPITSILTYAAGHGFRTAAIKKSSLRLGEGYAGQAALERRLVTVSDLQNPSTGFVRRRLLSGEEFVSYMAMPLIAKGRVTGVLELMHRDGLNPDERWLTFLEALSGQAAIAVDNAQLFEGLERSNTELALAYDATIEGWSRALDLRDKETEGHSQRVTELTLRLALAMGLREAELVHVRRGALLHDIGKMGVPDHILLKPAPLTDDEWGMMRQHPTFAHDMLKPIDYLRPALDIPYCHHEKWDGTGYPRGLRGEQIPLAARIFAVVDVWDALRSDRPYRPAWPVQRVRQHILDGSGAHFDPAVVETFLNLEPGDTN